MIIFRPHRELLCDSMAEAREFKTEAAMKKYIVGEWNNYFSIKDIVIDTKKTNDTRIGWENTRDVCTKRFGAENCIEKYGCAQCIGMCATRYDYKGERRGAGKHIRLTPIGE